MKRLNILLASLLVVTSVIPNFSETGISETITNYSNNTAENVKNCIDTIANVPKELSNYLSPAAKISRFAWPVGFIALWGNTFSIQSTIGVMASMAGIVHSVVEQNDKYWDDYSSGYFCSYNTAKVIAIGLAVTEAAHIIKNRSRIKRKLTSTKLAGLIGLGALSTASIIYLTLEQYPTS